MSGKKEILQKKSGNFTVWLYKARIFGPDVSFLISSKISSSHIVREL